MLTVTLATHNGAETLPTTLEAFTHLEEPEGGWKLIVVDNASTDGTAKILAAYGDRLPLTILNQPERGKNRALNLAIPHFEGDLVVFTDDDVVPETDWLVQLQKAADTHPDFDIFGGRIAPKWPYDPPDWLDQAVPLTIAFGLLGEKEAPEGPLNPGLIWGANMAIRKAVFDAGYRFDEGVGPQSGQYRMGSETEFTTRLAKNGYRAWHCASARVAHIVRPHQMAPSWIVGRAFRYGRDMFWKENDPAMTLGEKRPASAAPQLFGLPRWMYRRLIEEALKIPITRMRRDPEANLRARWNFAFRRGYIKERFTEEGRTLFHRRARQAQNP